MLLIRYSGSYTHWALKAANWQQDSYGSAWALKDSDYHWHVYFIGNSGNYGTYRSWPNHSEQRMLMRWYCAVFEADLSSIDTTQKTVNLIQLSFTAGSASMADGLTCPETLVPFPTSYADHETSGLTLSGDRCGDKDGRGVTVDPNPITDTDCGTGYWYDPVYRGTGCTSNPCDVSTPGSGDHSICCSSTQPGAFYS